MVRGHRSITDARPFFLKHNMSIIANHLSTRLLTYLINLPKIKIHVFLFTDSQNGIHKRSLYEHNGVAVCSQNRALIIASVVLAILFLSSLIIAYVGPQNGKSFSSSSRLIPNC